MSGVKGRRSDGSATVDMIDGGLRFSTVYRPQHRAILTRACRQRMTISCLRLVGFREA